MNKKIIRILMILFLSIVCVGMKNYRIEASTKTTNIKVGKVYKINIDGRKGTEKIYVKKGAPLYDDDDGWNYYSLYINDKKVKTISAIRLYCKIIDINTKEKGKEIVFYGEEMSAALSKGGGIFKYKKGTLKTLGKLGGNYKYFYIWRIDKVKTNGKGVVSITVDTPINVNIGSYYANIKFKIKNGKLKPIYTKKLNNIFHPGGWKYVLSNETTLYKKATYSSKKVTKIQKGSSVKITRVVYKKAITLGEGMYRGKNVYAYVKDECGNRGWIYVPEMDYNKADNFFAEYPGWG